MRHLAHLGHLTIESLEKEADYSDTRARSPTMVELRYALSEIFPSHTYPPDVVAEIIFLRHQPIA